MKLGCRSRELSRITATVSSVIINELCNFEISLGNTISHMTGASIDEHQLFRIVVKGERKRVPEHTCDDSW